MSDRNIMTFKQPTVAESRAELAQALRSMARKEYEVRATMTTDWSRPIFRVVRAQNEQIVKTFFAELCFRDIYVQEVPLSENYSLIL